MPKFGFRFLTLASVALVGNSICQAHESASHHNIVEVAVESENFTTLVTAVKTADLVKTLSGKGPFTVFAPTDEAFKKLPAGTLESLLEPENKGKLTSILTYHVVPGKVKAADIVKLKEAKTVEGSSVSISVEDGQVKIGSATVIATDIVCNNGVIHVIDAVMVPKAES